MLHFFASSERFALLSLLNLQNDEKKAQSLGNLTLAMRYSRQIHVGAELKSPSVMGSSLSIYLSLSRDILVVQRPPQKTSEPPLGLQVKRDRARERRGWNTKHTVFLCLTEAKALFQRT